MLSRSTSNKATAFFFILLLAGHDAARINQRSSVEAATRQVSDWWWRSEEGKGAEDVWRQENRECSWSWSRAMCTKGDGKGSCAFRYLPLDTMPSHSCRLTDDFMLNETIKKKYFLLQARLLSAKSKKFNRDCHSFSALNVPMTLKCNRRGMHMMRAMEFLSKAQTKSLLESLTPEEKQLAEIASEDSFSNLTAALGEDGPVLHDFQRKLKASLSSVRHKPKEVLNHIIKVCSTLTWGSEESRKQIREDVRQMDAVDDGSAAEADNETIGELAKQLEDTMGKQVEVLNKQNAFEPQNRAAFNDNGKTVDSDSINDNMVASLLEMHVRAQNENSNVVKAIVFVVLVLLLWNTVAGLAMALLNALLTWIFISLVACGVGTVVPIKINGNRISDCETNQDFGAMVQCQIKCTTNIAAKPFDWLGGAMKGVGDSVKSVGDTLSDSFGDLFSLLEVDHN